ncbi:hypothetical protein PYCCODRAFT_1366450, partial [Trametes coccinea BRFM310]
RQGSVVGQFLSGNTTHTPIEITSFWLRDVSGRPRKGTMESSLMFSPNVPYGTIKHARPALTSMCVQVCFERMLAERKKAVKGSNGLHGSAAARHGHRTLSWADINSGTVAQVQEMLQQHQPLTWHLMKRLASPAPYRDAHGLLVTRKSRPPELVATEILSVLDFAHTKFARLLPASRSVLFFACGVPRVIFDYCSRIGFAQSWSATYRLLIKLGEHEGEELKALGQDITRWPIIRLDNVQQYHKQRERRIGRESAMKIGVAAYAAEAFDFDPRAADVDDWRQRVAENQRQHLTVDALTAMVDFDHHELVMVLQWLQTLVTYVPTLARYRSDVAEVFRTEGVKLRAPCYNQKTTIRPLATVAKNEAVTTELRDALEDFLGQLGQTVENNTRRIIPIGGDGLTFEKLVQLKNYLQFQETGFKRFDHVLPFLEIWHTLWTYLSTIFETHWGEALTDDPSLLGHSVTKMHQPPPSNLKKVDYYPSLYQMSLVLDARMLDCWRVYYGCDDLAEYFSILDSGDRLPSLSDLRSAAQTLHERYSSQRAWFDAMEGGSAACDAGWPISGEGARPSESASAAEDSKESERISAKAAFKGDRTLAQSILFMNDAMLMRDASEAVAAGDIGRVWNDLKIILFKFAGSGHTKYSSYLLEMICTVELEMGPTLREVFLKNWLVNPSGDVGKTQEGDLLEEHMNLILEEVTARKGVDWDGIFMRDVISRNVFHFSELRGEWGVGVGLSKRRGAHTEPHSRPEMKILLNLYKSTQLHSFSVGRTSKAAPSRNLFAAGARALEESKLRKFILDSTFARIEIASESRGGAGLGGVEMGYHTGLSPNLNEPDMETEDAQQNEDSEDGTGSPNISDDDGSGSEGRGKGARVAWRRTHLDGDDELATEYDAQGAEDLDGLDDIVCSDEEAVESVGEEEEDE